MASREQEKVPGTRPLRDKPIRVKVSTAGTTYKEVLGKLYGGLSELQTSTINWARKSEAGNLVLDLRGLGAGSRGKAAGVKHPAPQMTLRVLQANLNRCHAAHDLLEARVRGEQVDMVIVSEPNNARVGPNWYRDSKEGDVAILLRGASSRLATSWGSPGKGIVWGKAGGTVVVAVYASPNRGIEEFREWLGMLEGAVKDAGSSIIVAGDFNAKAHQWGEYRRDARGDSLLDVMAVLDLEVANVGTAPTFRRRGAESIIDLTLATPRAMAKISNWQVLCEVETSSDHAYIGYEITGGTGVSPTPRTRWVLDRMDPGVLARQMAEGKRERGNAEEVAEQLSGRLRAACDAAIPKRKGGPSRRVFWWSDQVAAASSAANVARRNLTRHRRRRAGDS